MAEMMSKKEWLQLVSESAVPIDFDALIEDGILKRRSKFKYDVLDTRRIPKHVWRQARSIETATRNGETRTTITVTDNTKAMKRLLVKAVGERRANQLISEISGNRSTKR